MLEEALSLAGPSAIRFPKTPARQAARRRGGQGALGAPGPPGRRHGVPARRGQDGGGGRGGRRQAGRRGRRRHRVGRPGGVAPRPRHARRRRRARPGGHHRGRHPCRWGRHVPRRRHAPASRDRPPPAPGVRARGAARATSPRAGPTASWPSSAWTGPASPPPSPRRWAPSATASSFREPGWPPPSRPAALSALPPVVPSTGTCSSLESVDFNLADLFEAAADAFPDREYLVTDGRRLTYGQMEERANRLAHHLAVGGRGPGGPRRHLRAQQRRVGRDGLGRVQAAGGVDQHQLPLRRGRAPLPVLQRRPRGPRPPAPVLAPRGRSAARAACTAPRDRDRRRQRASPTRATTPSTSSRPSPAAHPSATSHRDRATTSTSSTRAGPPACPRAWCGRSATSSTPSAGVIDALTGVRMERPQQMVEKGLAAGGQLTFLPIAPLMHGAIAVGGHGPELRGQPDHVSCPGSTPTRCGRSSSARRSTWS